VTEDTYVLKINIYKRIRIIIPWIKIIKKTQQVSYFNVLMYQNPFTTKINR